MRQPSPRKHSPFSVNSLPNFDSSSGVGQRFWLGGSGLGTNKSATESTGGRLVGAWVPDARGRSLQRLCFGEPPAVGSNPSPWLDFPHQFRTKVQHADPSLPRLCRFPQRRREAPSLASDTRIRPALESIAVVYRHFYNEDTSGALYVCMSASKLELLPMTTRSIQKPRVGFARYDATGQRGDFPQDFVFPRPDQHLLGMKTQLIKAVEKDNTGLWILRPAVSASWRDPEGLAGLNVAVAGGVMTLNQTLSLGMEDLLPWFVEGDGYLSRAKNLKFRAMEWWPKW
ncbi:hypothetical protein B0T16DRAFT_450613 [Cercophora newfieldiana]|uniref:Uncharacterized protein n=1 Tax=Cercophora newfieldiana TaxID=92897 RepID=A0AA39YLP7_9PEZI|nr:hypothetical protein B0T16DRAFT_450613 [Cercophora newfieldiana]